MAEKIWKCQDGEHAPFWVTILFFSRADGQCFLPPCVVHQGADLSADFLYKIPADWIVHHSPSGYMDRDGWFKVIYMFTKLSGCHAGNIQMLFYDRHDSHWDADALDLMTKNFIQPFVLKAGDSENDQPQDNGSNAKLKSCYNNRKSEWSRAHLSTPYSPAFMNTVLVKTWQDFIRDSAGVIRRSFDKTKLCPLQPPSADQKYLGNACLSSLQCGTGKKSQELEIMKRKAYAPARFSSKRTTDEHVIINNQQHHPRNVIIRSIVYDAVYKTVVVPAQQLKDVQQEIDSLKKIKITKQMNPADTRMNPNSSSGIYVAGEARAHARLVETNKKIYAQQKAATKVATQARNSTNRRNRAEAFQRIRKTVLEQNQEDLSKALDEHKPASDFALALQHLGTKPKLLPDGKKATIISAITRLYSSAFSANASSTDASGFASSSMEYYEEVDDGIEFQVEEV